MNEAPLPGNEAARLAALRSYDILDTPAEEVFDDLTRVAARVCGTPIALVSLIDEDRQWFKSRVGLDATETPRALAFCAHAILDPEGTLVVEDATRDARFSDNPLVTGGPKVLFYAGAPLVTPDGFPLGTLCVIDNAPRTIDAEALETLRSLARATVTQLELRKACQELQQASRSLSQSNDQLERRNEEIRLFYQTLSHELKTPLTITRDYVSMVLDGLVGEIGSEQRNFLTIGVENCDRLARSVDDLLDVTRIEACKFHLNTGAVQLGDLLDSVTQGMKPLVDRADLQFSCHVDDNLPPVAADPDRVAQVLNNLIRNAIKFTPERGRITVAASCASPPRDFVEITVTDTGCGIPKGSLDRIFDRLYQCREEDCSARQGLGLGLHLSREIVRLHGGDITAENADGGGTTFRFRLPIHSAPSSEKQSQLSEEMTP